MGRQSLYSAAACTAASSIILSLSAFSTFGGDIGWSRRRTPTASWIALAIAGSGGMIGTSPMPRIP